MAIAALVFSTILFLLLIVLASLVDQVLKELKKLNKSDETFMKDMFLESGQDSKDGRTNQ